MNSLPDRTPTIETQISDAMRVKLRRLKWLLLDVDGVLTDGKITLTDNGEEMKSFHIADGLGLVALQAQGMKVGFVTGRQSPIVQRRAKELGVALVLEKVRDKGVALQQIAREQSTSLDEISFVGDDWNDLPAFALCGFRFAPRNAAKLVRDEADYVCSHEGGNGAVREICELILEASGTLRTTALTDYLASLRDTSKIGESESTGQ